MSALLLQQQALLGALLHRPGSPAVTQAQAQLDTQLQLPTARGLAAYRANGHALAERALTAAFPVLAAMVGDECLQALARTLWHHHPSRDGDIAEWGGALPEGLEHEPQLADYPYLADVARVEWALHRAASAPDAAADTASFGLLTQREPEDLDLQLVPGTAVVVSPWPVVSLVQAHRTGDPPVAALADRLHPPVAEAALVWRQDLRPRLRASEPAEVALLAELQNGHGLVPALDAALAADPAFDFSTWLARAVHEGLVLAARPRRTPAPSLTKPGA